MCTIKQSNNFETKHELNLKIVESRWISLKGPKILGYFSSYYNVEDVKVYCPNKPFLAYLDLPDPVFIDCLQGYDPNIKYGHQPIGHLQILRWVLDNEAILGDFPSDFICYNGLLKEMMMVRNSWEMIAIKIKGKIIMLRIDSKEKKSAIDEQSEWSNKSTYTAYNLRRLITKTDNGFETDQVKDGQCCHGVFHSKIGSNRILHAGWLDCVESKQELNKPLDEIKFQLIKKFHNNFETHSYLQAKCWWSLATLGGVETIICARCEKDFTVKKIDKLKVNALIPRERQMECYTLLNLILDYIKSNVTEENRYYNFCFNAVDRKFTEYLENEANENIIPAWYIDGQLPLES